MAGLGPAPLPPRAAAARPADEHAAAADQVADGQAGAVGAVADQRAVEDRAERAEDLGDGEEHLHGSPGRAWAGSGAAGSEMAMVRPPSGVCSGVSVPPIASVRPRDTVSPSPPPIHLPVSPSPWKARKLRSRSPAGT